MKNIVRYGVISETYENPGMIPMALNRLQGKVDKLILNGDIGTGADYIRHTLEFVGASGLETFVQPGSHEKLDDFFPVIRGASKRFPNIINAVECRKLEERSHHLVFLPGSDSSIEGGQYRLISDERNTTGVYNVNEGDGSTSLAYVTNIEDLWELVTAPEKTIVVCHVPRKFEHEGDGVDTAYFGQNSDGNILPGVVLERILRDLGGKSLPQSKILRNAKHVGMPLIKTHRGNEDLRKIYEELGITRAVSGHFHESGHRAHDSRGVSVDQSEYVDDLFWNSGCLDFGQFGILRVNERGLVSYENLTL